MGAFCTSLFFGECPESTSSVAKQSTMVASEGHRSEQDAGANADVGMSTCGGAPPPAATPPSQSSARDAQGDAPMIDFAPPLPPRNPNSTKTVSNGNPAKRRMSTAFTSSIRSASGELLGCSDNAEELTVSQLSALQRPKTPDALSWTNAAPSAGELVSVPKPLAHAGESEHIHLTSVTRSGSDPHTSSFNRRTSDSEEREPLQPHPDGCAPMVVESILLKPRALSSTHVVGAPRSPCAVSPARHLHDHNNSGSTPSTMSEPPCPASPLLSTSSSRRRREPPPVVITAVRDMATGAHASLLPRPAAAANGSSALFGGGESVGGGPLDDRDGRCGSPDADSELTTSSSRVSFVLPLGEPEVSTPKLRSREGASYGSGPQSPSSPRRHQGSGVGGNVLHSAAQLSALSLPPSAFPAASHDAQALLQRLQPDGVREDVNNGCSLKHENPLS